MTYRHIKVCERCRVDVIAVGESSTLFSLDLAPAVLVPRDGEWEIRFGHLEHVCSPATLHRLKVEAAHEALQRVKCSCGDPIGECCVHRPPMADLLVWFDRLASIQAATGVITGKPADAVEDTAALYDCAYSGSFCGDTGCEVHGTGALQEDGDGIEEPPG